MAEDVPENPEGCNQRHFVGSLNGSTLERTVASLSFAPGRPPLVPVLGAGGNVKTDPCRTGRRSLPARGIDIRETFIDSGFIPAEKKDHLVGHSKRGKRTKIMAIADAFGLPVAIDIQSASPHEVIMVETTIESRFISQPPERILGDKSYDGDPLDESFRQRYGTERIAPHKAIRKKPKTQNGRVLRRYRRRWKEELLLSWLYNFGRSTTRWEYHADNFLGMLQPGYIVIRLRYFYDSPLLHSHTKLMRKGIKPPRLCIMDQYPHRLS